MWHADMPTFGGYFLGLEIIGREDTFPDWAARDLMDRSQKRGKGQQKVLIGALYRGADNHVSIKAGGNEMAQLNVAHCGIVTTSEKYAVAHSNHVGLCLFALKRHILQIQLSRMSNWPSTMYLTLPKMGNNQTKTPTTRLPWETWGIHAAPSVPMQIGQLAHFLYQALMEDPVFNAPILEKLPASELAHLGSHLAITTNILARQANPDGNFSDISDELDHEIPWVPHFVIYKIQFNSIQFLASGILIEWSEPRWPNQSVHSNHTMHLPTKPRGSGACVKHVNRCKTSTDVFFHCLVFLYIGIRLLQTSWFKLLPAHFMSSLLYSRGWMHGLAVIHQRRLCLSMVIWRRDAFVTYLLHFRTWDVANPRTTMPFPNNLFSIFSFRTVFAICQGGHELA